MAQLPLSFEETVLLSLDEIWSLADHSLLKLLKEDRRVERKPARIHPRELAEYFSMWANTGIEGGLVAVGMANNGAFDGCLGIEIGHLNKIESDGHTMCPDARVECKRVIGRRDRDHEEDFVFLFRVHYHEHKVVHTTHGDAYIRRGESKCKLTSHEVRDLQNDKGEVRVEQELCPQYTYPEDFSAPLLDDFFRSARSSLTEEHTNEEILLSAKLGARKGAEFIPSAACVLLFANDPAFKFPGAKVRFLRFEGEHEGTGDEWNAVKDGILTGPIPYLIRATEKQLDQQLREFSRLGPDNRFYSAPEYPRGAWYEALVNACVHRSYGTMKNIPIFVKMFDNRLEIQSPGGFPPSVTPETIYGSHSPRNPNLMDALWSLDVVKCAAEGTRRMLRLMKESDLPAPEFTQKTDEHALVRVTLRNNVKQRRAWIDGAAISVVGPEIDATLNEQERQIINHVAEHGIINTSQAMRLTGRGWKSAHRLLLHLERRKILRYHHRKDIERDPDAFFALVPPKRVSPPSPSPEK